MMRSSHSVLFAICLVFLLQACDFFDNLNPPGDDSDGLDGVILGINAEVVALDAGAVILASGKLAWHSASFLGNDEPLIGSNKELFAVTNHSCPQGGQKTIDETATLYSADFTDCVYTAGSNFVTVNGKIELTDIIGTKPVLGCTDNYAFNISFLNFAGSVSTSLPSPNDNIIFNGGYAVQMNGTSLTPPAECELVDVSFNGSNALDIKNGTSTLGTLTELNLNTSFNRESGDYSIDTMDAVMDSVTAQGTLSVKVAEIITGNIVNKYPSTGKYEVSDGTALLTIIINSHEADNPAAVTMNLDTNGDGVPNDGYPKDLSWNDLGSN